MAYRCFDVDVTNSVAHLRMKRGDELNTMVPEFWSELPYIVRTIDAKAKARVIVISSTGLHFTAGMDLSVFADKATNVGQGRRKSEPGRERANRRRHMLGLQETFNVLEQARIPVLVAIQRGCIGSGLDLVSACDCRYATEDAFFVIQGINIGMTATEGTFPRLCGLLPKGWIRELAFSGRRLSAPKAMELGLVNDIFSTQALMLRSVMALAGEIAEKSPLAVYGSKVMINYSQSHSVADCLDYVATWQAGMHHPEVDLTEGLRARKELRTANYFDLMPIPDPHSV